MARMSIAFLMFLAAVGGQPSDAAAYDPLAEARAGKLQCYQPNLERRTCKGIAAFSFEPDGRVLNASQVLLDAPGPVVMHVTSPVEVRGDGVCGPIGKLEQAEFTVEGRPASARERSLIRLLMSAVPRTGEVCTRWVRDNDAFVAHGTLDGEEQPEFEQKMIWIGPDEGFVVAP